MRHAGHAAAAGRAANGAREPGAASRGRKGRAANGAGDARTNQRLSGPGGQSRLPEQLWGILGGHLWHTLRSLEVRRGNWSNWA